MTGMDRWIDWQKPDFVGRKAAMAERDGRARRSRAGDPRGRRGRCGRERLRADLVGGQRVGYVTSGGYGHTVGKSLAMALIEPDLATPGTALSVHVVGVERKAKVIAPSPYDPEGKAMRG